jgi:hypothetical protein
MPGDIAATGAHSAGIASSRALAMTSTLRFVRLVAPLALACAAALPAVTHAADVQGSGRLQTESRTVAPFQAVELKGSMNLVLRQGAREGVELRGDDNVLPLIETRVAERDGVPTLSIGTRPGAGYSTSNEVVVTVDLKTLSALTLSGAGDARADALKVAALKVVLNGAGDLRVDHLEADDLTSRISGSGDMHYAGKVVRASFAIAGSGDVAAADLAADDVNVRIAGSGDAAVTANRTLKVNIAGSGDVSYGGSAVVTSSVTGSGGVRKR